MQRSNTRVSPLAVGLQLTHAISRTERLEEIYEAALDALAAGLNVQRASILLFDPDGIMRFKAWRGLSDAYRKAVEGHTPWAPGVKDVQPRVVPDVTKDAGLAPFLATIQAERIAAMAFVPLVGSDGIIGKFMLYYAEPHELSADELQLADLIATQVAFAVERTQANVILEQSKRASQWLAAIVESSDDAIVSKGLDGVITSWNRSAERMFGYTAAEAVGRSIKLIIPPDRFGEEDRLLGRIRAGEPVEMETVRRHKDGSDVDISLMVSPVKDATGRIVGASKIARDIRARKRDEAARAELHRRLTKLVEASASLLDSPESEAVLSATLSVARQLLVADGYAVWMTESGQAGWRIVKFDGISDAFASRVIESYHGAPTPATAIFSEPLPVEDVAAQPLLGEQLGAYRSEGIRSMLVCPMRLGETRSGTLVFYYRTAHAFSEIDVQTGQALANLAAAAITTTDLYEEQRRQRRVAESARRQAAFLADATAILSRSLDYGQTLTALARLAVPEIADWCAVDIVDEAGQLQRLAVAHVDPAKVEFARLLEERYPADPNARDGVHEVIRTGTPARLETIPAGLLAASATDDEHRRILAELALTSYICVPLVSPSGTSGAMTFVFAESGRHHTDRDLAFAQEVAGRAALAIDNAHAYRRAHEANRLKDEFLATLSHELRTPLNAILGYGQMLELGVLKGERQSKAITVLARNADALKQIIDDVLDVSRIVSGKLRLKVEPLALGEILRAAAATMQLAADTKGVSLDLMIDDDIPPIGGDADRIRQIVWNLLSNAVKFTARDGHVQLRLHVVDSWIQIVVTDDGKGIEPAFLPHVFERFRQGDSRFSREHGGLGLGLAIVRELVELHGGSVTASSDGTGRGATFTVRLPSLLLRPRAAAGDEIGPGTADLAASGLPERLKGARVLAVDDEADALGLLRVILESAGAEVTTAASGLLALDLLRSAAYDAMIADIGMPRMDGLQLIRSVRHTLPAPANQVPAAALTAYARSEDRLMALASGFQMHIAKPVDPRELVTAVATLLGR